MLSPISTFYHNYTNIAYIYTTISYEILLQKEKAGKIIDIATLTGAVVNALGFSTAGALTNNKEFYQEFKKGYKRSGVTSMFHLFTEKG